MSNPHPITPPPELVRQWMERTEYSEHTWFYESYIAEQAAQWGADQELEACVEWLGDAPVVYKYSSDLHPGSYLRDARRPKPPTDEETGDNGYEALIRQLIGDLADARDALEAWTDYFTEDEQPTAKSFCMKEYKSARDAHTKACNAMAVLRRSSRYDRPKPPSLKEQALKQLDEISNDFRVSHGGIIACDKIRQALEALPND